eukprot:6583524-Prymnesium_polylepis.1
MGGRRVFEGRGLSAFEVFSSAHLASEPLLTRQRERAHHFHGVRVVHRHARIRVVLGVAKQRQDGVVCVRQHDVALVVQLDDELVLRRAGAARQHDEAVGTEHLDLLDAARTQVLAQLHRERGWDQLLLARVARR